MFFVVAFRTPVNNGVYKWVQYISMVFFARFEKRSWLNAHMSLFVFLLSLANLDVYQTLQAVCYHLDQIRDLHSVDKQFRG